MIIGTPWYMSPEQASGHAIDHRSDLFSLGSLLFAMCTAQPPFRASNVMAVMRRVCDESPPPISAVNPALPDWLGQIIAKLHAKKPADRFQSATEAADALRRRRFDRPHGPPRLRIALVANLLAGLIAGLATVLFLLFRAPDNHDAGKDHAAGKDKSAFVVDKAAGVDDRKSPAVDKKPPAPETLPVVGVHGKDGWIPLFNGADFTGWSHDPAKPFWRIEDGVLVGSEDISRVLWTDSRLSRNFHLRCQFKAGSARIYFLWGGIGYEATLDEIGTEALARIEKGAFTDLARSDIRPSSSKWNVLEIIVRGPTITLILDGRTTAEVSDEGHIASAGNWLGIRQQSPRTPVQIRKIEMKELPLP